MHVLLFHIDNLYIRRRSTYLMKFKPKKCDTYSIISWNEEISIDGIPKGRLGSITCVKDGQEFSVSAGLDDDLKDHWWKRRYQLPGKSCKIYYQTITAKRKVPKFVSKIEILESDPNINPLLNIGD